MEIQGKGTVMNRIDFLFEKWAELSSEAEMAILAYDAGKRKEGMAQFKHIWQMFQKIFAAEEDRISLEEAYLDTMNMILNRMYLELEETENDETLWDFCNQVCDLFRPNEIWREDYAVCIGRLLQKQGKYNECDRWFSVCLKEEPYNPVYIAEHAACMVQRGENDVALDMLAVGLKKYSKCNYLTLRFYRTAGKLYRKLQQQEQADLCRRRICELDKDLLLYED